MNAPPPRSPTACAPSPCHPGPTSARAIPAGAASTAKRTGLEHLVKFSAIGAHPAASFTFGRQHGIVERIIMDSGLAFKAGLLAAGQTEWQATALVELNTYARQGHSSLVTEWSRRPRV